MKISNRLGIVFFLLFITLFVHAANFENQWGLQYSLGPSNFIGDLSNESNAVTHDFQIQTMFIQNSKKTIEAYLAIDVLSLSAKHTGNRFPYPEQSNLHILAFLFIPTVCNYPNQWQYCFGIGQGTVNVNEGSNRRDYGTWNYQALIKYALHRKWWITFMGKYVGRIEQRTNDVDGDFSFTTFALGITYRD